MSLVGRWAAYFSHSATQDGRGFASMHASKKCGKVLKFPSGSYMYMATQRLRGQGSGICHVMAILPPSWLCDLPVMSYWPQLQYQWDKVCLTSSIHHSFIHSVSTLFWVGAQTLEPAYLASISVKLPTTYMTLDKLLNTFWTCFLNCTMRMVTILSSQSCAGIMYVLHKLHRTGKVLRILSVLCACEFYYSCTHVAIYLMNIYSESFLVTLEDS